MSEIEWIDIFANNLKDYLREYRQRQYELAEDSGLSEAAVSYFISKRRMPNIYSIINMAFALDADFDEFIMFDEKVY